MTENIIYIGIDDTDNLDSRGTGRLARDIAAELAGAYDLLGVTRHQLLFDERIPYTARNSCAAIALQSEAPPDLEVLFQRVRALILADFQPGSDPGLCVVTAPTARRLSEYGQRAKREILTQELARETARQTGALLAGLGGDNGGVIGALAATGLAACGEDGRYVLVGRSRQLAGLQPIERILEAGITAVQTCAGQPVSEGLVLADKLRPARRGGQPVLFVENGEQHWLPLKLE